MNIQNPIVIDTEDQSHLAQLTAVRHITDAFLSQPTSRIPLDLPRWTALRPAQPINNASNDVNQVKDVLQYFLDLVTENSLQDTVAAQKLTDAINNVLAIKPKTNITKIPGSRRTSYAAAHQPLIQTNNQILASITKQGIEIAREAVYEVPIFNIWDSLSLIYTLCVEEIQTDRGAQLHLLQFRTIIRILSSHWYMKSFAPSTVAAAWSISTFENRGKCIAFATSCGGKGTEKQKNAEARFKFAKKLVNSLTKLVAIEEIEGLLESYERGNCVEYETIIIVCRLPGYYLSLCLNLEKNRIYKMCGHCDSLVYALAEMAINVEDLWLITELGTGPGVEIDKEVGFSYRELLSYEYIKDSLCSNESGM
jgi:hypothetical protein